MRRTQSKRWPWRLDGSVSVHIDADPHQVYARVSDVSRIGERDPECRAAQWLPGAPPGSVGARFRGHNRSGRLVRWARTCEVTEAAPGRSFVFRTVPELDPTRRDSTTWGYHLEPEVGGTRITHWYEITTLPLPPMRLLYGFLLPQHRDMRPQMLANLTALKAHLESQR